MAATEKGAGGDRAAYALFGILAFFTVLRPLWIIAFDSFGKHYWRYSALALAHGLLCGLIFLAIRKGAFARLQARGGLWAALFGALYLPAAAAYLALFDLALPEPKALVLELCWVGPLAPFVLNAVWPRRWLANLCLSAGVLAILGLAAELVLAHYHWRFSAPQTLIWTSELREGGHLKPNLKRLTGKRLDQATIVTNSKGFRSEREFDYQPTSGVFRIIYIGDSFAAGFGTGQQAMSGAVLEGELRKALPSQSAFSDLEVMIGCVDSPVEAAYWADQVAPRYAPQLLLFGLCVGNDMIQSYVLLQSGLSYEYDPAGRRILHIAQKDQHWNEQVKRFQQQTLLPPEAFTDPSPLTRRFSRMGLTLRSSGLGWTAWLAADRISPVGISDNGSGDVKGKVHYFDMNHGLGYLYDAPHPGVDATYACLEQGLSCLQAACARHDIALLVAVFPQRTQVGDGDWRATVRRYALRPERFNRRAPNERIAQLCRLHGIRLLDLTPQFAQESAKQGLYMHGGDMHWNDRGHRLAGELLAEHIARNFLQAAP